jgi:signal transduction histidine kinase
MIRSYESRAVTIRTAQVQNQCTILSDQLSKMGYVLQPELDVRDTNLALLAADQGRVLILNQDLEVLKDTYGFDEGKTVVSDEVVRAMKGTSSQSYLASEQSLEVVTPIFNGNTQEVEGVLLVRVSTDEIADQVSILTTQGEMILGIVFVLILGLSVFLSDKMVKPLCKITRSIVGISEGYDDNVLRVDTFTETKEISDAFNMTLQRLKQLDDSREEFVSNVSHELRTPLTSMKVLADSLLSMEEVPLELYQEFMGDIVREIDRENDIITDLLSLVKMDKRANDINIRSVQINELLEQILKRLKPIAQKKNVEVVLESFRPVTAEIDEVKLSLAFTNLVENAIKYNQVDGWVHVSLNADHKFFYVKVSDSGIGIPAEDQIHIFDRFYRVDKSHSREIGGTGLGLSIARNAVILHRGSIKVYSSEGEGTTFTVRIPLIYVA